MPTTSPITAATVATPGSSTDKSTQGKLGKDDFLKLLVGQLRNQNPSDPTDSSEFMGQMTQFSILEQLTNLSAAQEASTKKATVDQATGLVGRTVSWIGTDKTTKTGAVEKVEITQGTPYLVIGSARVEPGQLTEVR